MFPNLRPLAVALQDRDEAPYRRDLIAALDRMPPTLRSLGTRIFFRLGCQMRPLVRHLERFGGEDGMWLLAALMARVNQNDNRRVPWGFCLRHMGAPWFGIGEDGRALAYLLDQARLELPQLRRYWLNHLMAQAAKETDPWYLVWPRERAAQAGI